MACEKKDEKEIDDMRMINVSVDIDKLGAKDLIKLAEIISGRNKSYMIVLQDIEIKNLEEEFENADSDEEKEELMKMIEIEKEVAEKMLIDEAEGAKMYLMMKNIQTKSQERRKVI